MSNDNYNEFIRSKSVRVNDVGFSVEADTLNAALFPFQRAIVEWSVRLGKAAIFAECGLGKTLMQLDWARVIAEHTGRKVLILSPLAVANQTVGEGRKFGIEAHYSRSQMDAEGCTERIIVTNYDMLKAFQSDYFAGVVLDESSILKNFTGQTKRMILNAFESTPYKLACTATPAPNDHLELGNHAQFLDVMQSNEMISRWFINDTMKAGSYRLKGHAEKDYWHWVTGWAVCISKPSDMGYEDNGFTLPPLNVHEHVVGVDHTRAFAQGKLLLDGTVSATAMWREKSETAQDRCDEALRVVATDTDSPWIVWCDTNKEADILKKLLPEAVEVRGSDTVAHKEDKLMSFSDGRKRIIITKADIAGFGMNWQHCANQADVSVDYSYEKWHQRIRRSWRFGQKSPVNTHLIYAESEGQIVKVMRQKQAAHVEMQAQMNEAMRANGLSLVTDYRAATDYKPEKRIKLPAWLSSQSKPSYLPMETINESN